MDVPAELDDSQELVPYDFTERVWRYPWMGEFLKNVSMMPVITLACAAAGVAPSWAYECRKRFPAFKEAWDEAKTMRAPELVEGTTIRYAMSGVPIKETRTKTVNGVVTEVVVTETVALSPMLLKHINERFNPEYRPANNFRHEHTGAGGTPIKHDHEVALGEVNRWPTEERARELARLALEFGIEPRTSPLVIEAVPIAEDDDDSNDS